jgi:hypothetical protein
MPQEEKRINGVLCWRNTPNKEWQEYSKEELTLKIRMLRAFLNTREARLKEINDQLEKTKKRFKHIQKAIEE